QQPYCLLDATCADDGRCFVLPTCYQIHLARQTSACTLSQRFHLTKFDIHATAEYIGVGLLWPVWRALSHRLSERRVGERTTSVRNHWAASAVPCLEV